MAKIIVFINSIIIIVLFLSSCATIINSKNCKLKIDSTPKEATILYNDSSYKTPHIFTFPRSKTPLNFTLIKDSLKKDITVLSSMNGSFLYGNLTFFYFCPIGYIVDFTNQKRFYYGKHFKINLSDTTTIYRPKVTRPYYTFFCESYRKISDTLLPRNIIKISPLNLTDNINPSIQLSYERMLLKKVSAQIELGYILPGNIFTLNHHDDHKGFIIRAGINQVIKNTKHFKFYIGSDIFFIKTSYNALWSFTDPGDSLYSYEDHFRVHKTTYGLNIKLGFVPDFHNFYIEYYFGLGVKHKDIYHTGRMNPNDKIQISRHPNPNLIAFDEGNYWTINIPFNIKIGFRF